jgi:hypothetical protein
MKKVASMLLALALLVSPMKSAFAENKIYTTIKEAAERVENAVVELVSKNKERFIFILICLFLSWYNHVLNGHIRDLRLMAQNRQVTGAENT